MFDITQRIWAADLLAWLGLDPARLPVPQPSWTIAGELRPALMRRFGLARPVPVIAGAADSLACALGAGVTGPGPVSELAGSSTCLTSVVAQPLPDLDVAIYASPMGPVGYMTETGINTAGEALDWVAALAYGGRGGRPRASDYERLDREAAGVPPGADGLLFVPVLGDGERDDPALRGTVTGLSLRHGRAAWAPATMEGGAFGMRALLAALGRGPGPPAEPRGPGRGGGAGKVDRVQGGRARRAGPAGARRRDRRGGGDAGRDRGRRLLRPGRGGRGRLPPGGTGAAGPRRRRTV